jgi:HK97 family phage major capsid protein/HK97 family phage prohead protease
MDVIRKVTVAKAAGNELSFVLSDEARDRMGDEIRADGWNLKNFQKNPIALFNHSSNFPIGFWRNVRIDGKQLIGDLTLAAEGTSARIDEIRRLVEQGILRAVSVGFLPSKHEEMKNGGYRYLQQELVETSLVSVPANPNAVQLAKSLNVSDDTINLVFGEQAERGGLVVRGSSGGQAKKSHNGTREMNIAQQIEAAQSSLVALQDQLQEQVANNSMDESVDDIADKIDIAKKEVSRLQRVEQALASASQPIIVRDTDTGRVLPHTVDRRPWAAPKKELKPYDHLFRSATAAFVARCKQQNPIEAFVKCYGEDRVTRGVLDIVTRAASAPALTTTTGWALELATTGFLGMIDTLMPDSVYPKLSNRGPRFTFGQYGTISIPARSTATTIAGSFVGQGNPIPVRQGGFTATTLTPKKMAVISTFSREMAEHSSPQIEPVIRQAIVEDTSVAIDAILLDNVAATAIRPAGLRAGVAAITATTGGGLNALVGDIKALVGALTTSTNGHLRDPVWIMNPAQVISIGLQTNAQGMFIFQEQIAAGRFMGYPLITSTTVTAGMVILVDAADFFSATGDAPMFAVSDQATLHMEDTNPLPIATGAQGSGVLATPTRSLWQTDSIGIRMVMDLNWALRRTGVVAWTQSVTW